MASPPGLSRRRATVRDLLYFQTASLWPRYPFLPLIRRTSQKEMPECGLLYDARGTSDFRCTVLLVNLLLIPPTEAEFLTRPKCIYDTFDQLADDGWVVD